MSTSTPPPAHILVGVDGSETSVAALREGIALAEAFNLPVRAVMAWEWPGLPQSKFMKTLFDPEEEARQKMEKVLADGFGGELPDIVTTEVIEGTPAEALIKASEDARILVVGSRGLGGFSGMVLGSVSNAVAAHAKCPVLVVR